jgi:hypothetical protein
MIISLKKTNFLLKRKHWRSLIILSERKQKNYKKKKKTKKPRTRKEMPR